MTITEPATTEQDAQRAAELVGLYELADFLTTHPDVPIPVVMVSAPYRDRAAVAGWIDGLDTIDVQDEYSPRWRKVIRQFAGLTVAMHANVELLGETRPVQTTVDELVPFTVDQIRERAAADAAAVTA